MNFCSGTGQNLSFIGDFTKDFVVVCEAFVGVGTVGFLSGDVRNSFLYCGSELECGHESCIYVSSPILP